jgi:anti-sigma factor RsiW
MDCTLTQEHLIGYHFAALEDGDREGVERHLLECTACLKTYLALKAHVDRAGSDDGPSEQARLRLRAEVARRFTPTLARRASRWLVRPVPLYQGVALAVAVAAAVVLAPSLARRLTEPPAHAAERVDTSRVHAESLSIY